MTKYKFFINYDKEEKWLEEMAKRGYQLKDTRFCYRFNTAPPENLTIKIDFRMFRRNEDFLEYCTLFEDSGWQHIAGTSNSGTQYFTKIKPYGDEDIFSDSSSRAGRYKRLADMYLVMTIAYFVTVIAMFTLGQIQIDGFMNPREMYLTPGLWEMSGLDFWRSFLFETPFVLMRELSGVLMISLFFLFIIGFIKSWKQYKLTCKD